MIVALTLAGLPTLPAPESVTVKVSGGSERPSLVIGILIVCGAVSPSANVIVPAVAV